MCGRFCADERDTELQQDEARRVHVLYGFDVAARKSSIIHGFVWQLEQE